MTPAGNSALASSRVWRSADGARAATVAAVAHSAAVARGRLVWQSWQRLPWPERRRKIGSLLIVAAAVHMLLLGRAAHGWPEFIIPVTVVVIGVLALATSPTRVEPHA